MSVELTELLKEVRAARDHFGDADSHRNARIDKLETALNDIARKLGRPGYDGGGLGDDANRKAAIGLLRLKHDLKIPRHDIQHPCPYLGFNPLIKALTADPTRPPSQISI